MSSSGLKGYTRSDRDNITGINIHIKASPSNLVIYKLKSLKYN